MSFLPYVSPDQGMKDKSEYAHKGIARGRSVIGLEYADGLLFIAENPSATLHKISEIYDHIAFAGVGKYSEFEDLRIAGIRLADRRIFGLENEYGVTCTFRGQRRLSPDEVARYLFRRVVHWGRSSNVFLENGARLYLDVGSHPEYATPECDHVADLVAHDKAGERILEALLAAAEVRLREEGISGDVYLFKNNTDSAGNSYGCHENYLVARQGEFARIADVLIPFFVTRQVYCGAGKVLHGPRGAQFCISQRAEHIWEGVSSATTRSRPIINTRDEPHADAERFRRLHVIVGDSNLSEVATFLKVGTTALVLAMVEDDFLPRDLTLATPVAAMRKVSYDLTPRSPLELADGTSMTALEMQWVYFDRAKKYAEEHGLECIGAPEVGAELLRRWGGVLTGLETDPTTV